MILPCYLQIMTYFASFTGYEDDIFEVISNLHTQGSTFGGKFDKFGGKSFFKIEICGIYGVGFFPSLDCGSCLALFY